MRRAPWTASHWSRASRRMGSWILSPDGLWVAFTSRASTLVPGDTNGVADIFLRSVTGEHTTRVSVAADGTQADGASQSPGVSAGAQRIVFASSATNLVPGDTNGLRDVFLVERAGGQVVRLSETEDRANADGVSDTPGIDDAGRVVAFATLARNLVPALASSTTAQIVVATLPASTAAALVGDPVVAGAQALGAPALGLIDVTKMLKQLASGALPPGTATVQPGDRASTQPEVCGNGTCLGYATDATNLTPAVPDTNGVPDVVRQPVVTPPPPTAPPPIERLSTDVEGNPGREPSTRIALSRDGGVVAMESAAALTPEATAFNPDGTNVFVRALPVVVATMFPVAAQVNQATTVTLTGTGFKAGAVVLFGAVARDGAASADGRTLTVMTPTAPAQGVAPGVAAVTVRNPDGSTVPLFQAFTFLAAAGAKKTGHGHGCRRVTGCVGSLGGVGPAIGLGGEWGQWRSG